MDSLFKKAGMPGQDGGREFDGVAADFAAGAFVLPVLTGIQWIGWDRDERCTRRSMKRTWAFGDQDATATAIALQAGPIWVRRFSSQAAVSVVFALGAT